MKLPFSSNFVHIFKCLSLSKRAVYKLKQFTPGYCFSTPTFVTSYVLIVVLSVSVCVLICVSMHVRLFILILLLYKKKF